MLQFPAFAEISPGVQHGTGETPVGQLLPGPIGSPHKSGGSGEPIAADVGQVKSDIHNMRILQSFLPDLLNGGHVDFFVLGLAVNSERKKNDKAQRESVVISHER